MRRIMRGVYAIVRTETPAYWNKRGNVDKNVRTATKNAEG